MAKNKPTIQSLDRLKGWRDLLILLLFFLYIWLRINPRLYYQQQEPVFYLSWNFFRDFFTYPGGLTDYLSAFLSQFFYFSWAGALVITLVAGFVSLSTIRMIQAIVNEHQKSLKERLNILHLLPVILLIGIHNNYEHTLNLSLGYLLALAAASVYMNFKPKKTVTRVILFIGSAMVLYYIIGGPFLLFAGLCLLYELLVRGDFISSVAIIIVAGLIPYLASTIFFMVTVKQAYTYLLPFDLVYKPVAMPYVLYLYHPLLLLGLGLRLRFFPDGTVSLISGIPLFKKAIQRIYSGIYRLTVDTVVIIGLGTLVSVVSFNELFFSYLKINYFAETGQWGALLKTARKYGVQNETTACMVNRALFHQGKLLNEMFSFPQYYGVGGLFMSREYRNAFPIIRSDIFFEMGHLNEADHWVREAITLNGENPRNLKRLAEITLLKGEKEACRKCLRILDKSLLFRGWTDRYYQYLENDSLIAGDSRLSKIRSMMPNADFIVMINMSDYDLEQILIQNPDNQMAFEYLLASYLLQGDIHRLMESFRKFSRYKADEIPRYFDEAMLIYMTETKEETAPIPGNFLAIQKTIKEFNKVKKILVDYKGDKWRAQQRLKQEFGDTYWYYALYNLRPSNE